MEPLFFVMAIMGCSDGSANCAVARVEQTRYVSYAQCQADMPVALQRNTDIDFPVVTASCRKNGVEMAQATSPKPRS